MVHQSPYGSRPIPSPIPNLLVLTWNLASGCPSNARNNVGHTSLTILDSMVETTGSKEARDLLEQHQGDEEV